MGKIFSLVLGKICQSFEDVMQPWIPLSPLQSLKDPEENIVDFCQAELILPWLPTIEPDIEYI